MELPWTVGPALTLALLVGWLLNRRNRAIHALLASCSLIAAFAVNKYLQPWESSSLWPKALGAFLVFLAVVEFSQAIWNERSRNAA